MSTAKIDQSDDGVKAHIVEHLLITEVETDTVLVNQRGQASQQPTPVENEEDDTISTR
jgi:hypothetical protein